MIRLDKIASLTDGFDKIADIGSDHAYVCIKAINKYNVSKAYACDINIGPLNNAILNIKQNNLEDKIYPILSNGLDRLESQVDCIIISGMGGSLVVDILSKDIDKAKMAKCLILQPNSEVEKVREFAVNNDFYIDNEYMVFEKKHYYQIIVLKQGQTIKYNNLDIKYGPVLRKDKSSLFIELYNKKLLQLEINLTKINDNVVASSVLNEILEIREIING